MKCLISLLALVAVAAFAIGTIGCSRAPQPAPAGGQSHDDHADHDHDDHADHDHDAAEEQDEHAEALVKLSEEDRALAEKQKVCPVSGQPLGSMGVPVKVTVNERDVFLCCEGCRASLLEDPDKYLAKLDSPE